MGRLNSQSDSRIRLYNASATYVAVKWFFNFDLSRHCNLCRYSIKSRSRMCWDLNIRKPKRLGSSVSKCCNLNTFEISTWLNSEIKYSGEIQWNWIMLPPRHKTPLRYKPMPLTTCLNNYHNNYIYTTNNQGVGGGVGGGKENREATAVSNLRSSSFLFCIWLFFQSARVTFCGLIQNYKIPLIWKKYHSWLSVLVIWAKPNTYSNSTLASTWLDLTN